MMKLEIQLALGDWGGRINEIKQDVRSVPITYLGSSVHLLQQRWLCVFAFMYFKSAFPF